ncbi:MAG: ribonuclease R [Clostridia bacterium]|nr:ribonuclease R [Clostridia bacterium]
MYTDIVLESLQKQKRPVEAKKIADDLQLSESDVLSSLNALAEEGRAVLTKQHKYASLRVMELTLATARVLPGAPSFARPVDGGNDIYLDMPEEIAMDGDRIHVRLTAKGDRPRGILVRVVRRAHKMLTGNLFIETEEHEHRRRRKHSRPRPAPVPEVWALIPDKRLPARISVEGDLVGAAGGDLCLFEVTKWPRKGAHMTVRVIRLIGQSSDLSAQLEAVLAQNGISKAFSEEALAMSAAFPQAPQKGDYAGRRDLRDMEIFTIDGRDAQDFDDAVSLSENSGVYTLGVHIADVSHYVTIGCAIDADARQRGTSVYLPGLTVPMLPEALSNGLCSLRPNEDRLTYSIMMTVENGRVTRYELFEAVIRSKARLTYDDVNDLFAGRETTVPQNLHETLFLMNEFAKTLTKRRIARGAIELDLPEPEFVLGEDLVPTDARARERGDAHRLIEEFMLIANETVAAHAQACEIPFPYRVHEAPDSERLETLEMLLSALGRPHRLGASPSPAKLQEVLNDFNNRPESVIVARTILRSMSRARYLDKPLGHYGLAARDYCHFTSPIRRYPDLLAHRMLKMHAKGKLTETAHAAWAGRMGELAQEASVCEEQAAQCERTGDQIMCAAYLSNHIGRAFTGVVTHLSRRGAFVTLKNTAEGKIPPQLMDDFYELDDDQIMMVGKKSRRVVRLGAKIRVEVYSANIPSGEVEFAMLEERKPKRKSTF